MQLIIPQSENGKYRLANVKYNRGYNSGVREIRAAYPDEKDEFNDNYDRYMYEFDTELKALLFIERAIILGYRLAM